MATHSVEVFVRFKPTDADPAGDQDSSRLQAEVLSDFSYPAHVVTGSEQALMYQTLTGRLFEKLSQGYSCTMLAYGQTGSGKTHTMFGAPGSLTEASLQAAVSEGGSVPPLWGIFPRALLQLLAIPTVRSLNVSAVEVYMDVAYDLFADRAVLKVGKGAKTAAPVVTKMGEEVQRHLHSTMGGMHSSACTCFKCHQAKQQLRAQQQKDLQARQAAPAAADGGRAATHDKPWARAKRGPPSGGPSSSAGESFHTVGEKLMRVEEAKDIAVIARVIESERVAHQHNLNQRSSRSHCLLRVHITELSEAGLLSKRQFLFVDLAGSERVHKSGVQGARLAEATNINASLTTLARVITALSSSGGGGSKGGGLAHAPFRESTLTMLLRTSFAGKSCTSVVVNASSDPAHKGETLCSLRFGSRVAAVRTEAAPQEAMVSASKEHQRLSAELARLRAREAQLAAAKQNGHCGADCNPTEAASFLENTRRWEEYKKEYQRLKGLLTETAARNEPVPPGMDAKCANALKEADNLRDIIARQKTITGLWIEPTPAYNRLVNEIAELESQLQML